MTLSQYIVAWSAYIFATLACLMVWWRMTRPFNPTLASWLRLIATVLLLTPGLTIPDFNWLSPALFSIVYEILSHGPEGIALNCMILGGTLTAVVVIKLLFFPNALRKNTRKRKPAPDRFSPRSRKEPRI